MNDSPDGVPAPVRKFVISLGLLVLVVVTMRMLPDDAPLGIPVTLALLVTITATIISLVRLLGSIGKK